MSVLGKAKLQTATTTVAGQDEPDAARKDKAAVVTPSLPVTQPGGPTMGVTVTVAKPSTRPVMGKTVTKSPKEEEEKEDAKMPMSPSQATVIIAAKESDAPSPAKPAFGEGGVLEGDEVDDEALEEIPSVTPTTLKPEDSEETAATPRSPIKAWGEEVKQSTATKGARTELSGQRLFL